MILTGNWRESSGARAEKEYAENRGIPVFLDLHTLESWAEE